MDVMTSSHSDLPRGTALTAYSLAELVETGKLDERPARELIDGVLIEMPGPSRESARSFKPHCWSGSSPPDPAAYACSPLPSTS